MRLTAVLLLAAGQTLLAQSALSLADAVQVGLKKHPAIEASAASKRAADARIEGARSGYLPKLNYSESITRSDNPVFVFGSLLEQHQFSENNFALGTLNRPNFLNNFQSQVSVRQTVFDAGATQSQVRAARLGSQIAAEDERRARMNVIAGVAGAYFGAMLAKERLAVALEAVQSAEADLTTAQTVRRAGMSTDADVLSVRVHWADMREREIQARYAVNTAQAALDDALGQPLDATHDLSTPLNAAKLNSADLAGLEKTSVRDRAEARQAALAVSVTEAESAAARSALFPRVSVRGAFEGDRQTFATKGGANWLFAASLDWNVFNGFADRSRREEAEQRIAAARAEQKQTESGVELQVRRAYADWQAAQERIGVAEAAVAQAEESLRITRNRYQAGLTTVTELLRNETATLETQTNRLEAIYQQRVAATALELAAGTLSGDSDALK
ncbi:MAG TPA: TolC family protein [Bryobacteraceae bacterium]|nr:TolC family protein [Bryobacteraceae bacterium]